MKFSTRALGVAVTTFALCAQFGVANAALSSVDLVTSSGDGLITRDSQSGLDWLDVTLTTNQTMDQVRTGIWYQQGFRYATQAELRILFEHAGTPDDGFDIDNTYPAETLALAQLLGPTLDTGSRVSVMGFTGTDFLGTTVSTSTHPIGQTFSALLGKVDYLGIFGEAHFSGGHPFSNQADSIYGSFLVRAVPEPESYALLLAGLGLIGGVARRQRRSSAAL